MSPITPAQHQPSSPDGKPSNKASKGIPVWWSLVALSMAALVYLPILYADTHGKKPAVQEEPQAAQKADAQPETKVAASSGFLQPQVAAKQAEPAETPAVAPGDVTSAKEPAKPSAAAEAAPPEPAKAEPAKSAAADVTEPKEEPAKAEPAKPAAVEAVEPKEPAKAEPEKTAAAEVTQMHEPVQAEPAKPASAAAAQQKQSEEKPAPTVTAQAQNEVAQAAKSQEESQAKQKVTLTKPAEKLKVGDDTIFYRIEGSDKEGRAAAFDFITLTNDYKWALGSASRVVSGGKLIPESQTANRILAPNVRDVLANVTDVIGVGLASQDGKRADEEARALARSKTAAAWIKQAAKPGVGLWTLSLGQYDSKACKKNEDAESNFDRPVLFVSVRSKAEGVNLQEALADAIGGHNNLPNRDCYSRFDLAKVQ